MAGAWHGSEGPQAATQSSDVAATNPQCKPWARLRTVLKHRGVPSPLFRVGITATERSASGGHAVGGPDASARRVRHPHRLAHAGRAGDAGARQHAVALSLAERVAARRARGPGLGAAAADRGHEQQSEEKIGFHGRLSLKHGVQLGAAGVRLQLVGVNETRSRWRPPWWLVLGVAWVLGAAVGGHYLTRGWVPHDAGSLAQSAERVLAGELPHRDFDDVYTGGLSFLHALAFRLFGTSLLSLRLVLFAAFLAWLPAVYYVAGRFVPPLAAGLATLAAALWTVPNYSEAVPSWYNLFLAVFGVAALLRHLETGGRRWLVAAGVAGGVSCLAKIVGLYYVAAVLLFLVYREHCLAREQARPGGRGYVRAVGAGLLALVALVAGLIRRRAGAVELIDFVV